MTQSLHPSLMGKTWRQNTVAPPPNSTGIIPMTVLTSYRLALASHPASPRAAPAVVDTHGGFRWLANRANTAAARSTRSALGSSAALRRSAAGVLLADRLAGSAGERLASSVRPRAAPTSAAPRTANTRRRSIGSLPR